ELPFDRDDFDSGEDIQDLLNRYERSERPLAPGDEALVGGPVADFLEAGAQLPTRATIGVAWQPASRTDLVASYSEDLTEGDLGGSWERNLGIGLEQRFWLFAVRAGAATDTDREHMLTAGVSLGPLDLGLARLSTEEDTD